MLKFGNRKIILASASPRRKQLLEGLDIPFSIRLKEGNEDYPIDLENEKVALFLAKKKSSFYFEDLAENEILITSDTTVIQDHQLLNKPKNKEEAKKMLRLLSGGKHRVITGVCICSLKKEVSFDTCSFVTFKNLDEEEISYYVEKYEPLDKAGAYGIQEWLGFVAIEKIEGSYFNIMGFPVHRIYEELKRF